MSASQPRPRVVTAAFWCWLVAAVLLIVFGLLSLSATNAVALIRGTGLLFMVAGLALAFLAGRTRDGQTRFRRATVALALALAVLLALYCLISGGVLWLAPMVLTMVAAVLVMRPSAEPWFAARSNND